MFCRGGEVTLDRTPHLKSENYTSVKGAGELDRERQKEGIKQRRRVRDK